MARIAQRLRKEFRSALKQTIIPLAAIKRGEENAESIEAVEDFIADGLHPLHAIYANLTNLIGLFVEQLVCMPFLHRAHSFLVKAEDLYTPGYPPMSPITKSHYNNWTLFDVRFGPDQETLGECFIEVADLLEIDPLQVEAGQNLCRSRLGMYQIASSSGAHFQLRELITDRKIEAIMTSGFKARPGGFVLVRLLPPLQGIPFPHIGVTTPYVLAGSTETDWIEYFRLQQILVGAPGAEERLRRHMKYGKDDWYWCEFLFYGYVNHRSDAIFVTGSPDRPETLPHHKNFDVSTVRGALVEEQMA
jgi:hypothetical protein